MKSMKYISHTLEWLKWKLLTNIHEGLGQPELLYIAGSNATILENYLTFSKKLKW